MKQYEVVIHTMESNGGFATLGFLYQKVLKVPGVEWRTKTPFASIRRIVQDDRFFFKIRPGLWALKGWEKRLPLDLQPYRKFSKQTRNEFNHTYYQGLITEIGNLKGFRTFVPSQDKNKIFLNKKLSDVASIKEFYQFSYDNIIQKAKTIDVTWFNIRKIPDSVFEVEYSTEIQNALLKFVELQDFTTKMFVVADSVRQREFRTKLNLNAFLPIQNCVQFLDFEKVAEWHSKVCQFYKLEKEILYKE
jgi:hypothetical protein